MPPLDTGSAMLRANAITEKNLFREMLLIGGRRVARIPACRNGNALNWEPEDIWVHGTIESAGHDGVCQRRGHGRTKEKVG